jgi:hypothetical protein
MEKEFTRQRDALTPSGAGPPGRSDSPLLGWLRHHDKDGT